MNRISTLEGKTMLVKNMKVVILADPFPKNYVPITAACILSHNPNVTLKSFPYHTTSLKYPEPYSRTKNVSILKPGTERVQALTDISRSGYVVIAMKPVQIRPVVYN